MIDDLPEVPANLVRVRPAKRALRMTVTPKDGADAPASGAQTPVKLRADYAAPALSVDLASVRRAWRGE